jgi:hypothetical protein
MGKPCFGASGFLTMRSSGEHLINQDVIECRMPAMERLTEMKEKRLCKEE